MHLIAFQCSGQLCDMTQQIHFKNNKASKLRAMPITKFKYNTPEGIQRIITPISQKILKDPQQDRFNFQQFLIEEMKFSDLIFFQAFCTITPRNIFRNEMITSFMFELILQSFSVEIYKNKLSSCVL